MKIRVFSIPLLNPTPATAALDEFLKSHLIMHLDRELVADGRNSFWTVCVCAEELIGTSALTAKSMRTQGERVDYREVLSPADFAVFARLRTVRSGLAIRDGVPVYGVLNNEHLAQIAMRRPSTVAQLIEIPGIGETRAQKYGNEFLKAVLEFGNLSTSIATAEPGPTAGTAAKPSPGSGTALTAGQRSSSGTMAWTSSAASSGSGSGTGSAAGQAPRPSNASGSVQGKSSPPPANPGPRP
jgi:ribonuclease D